MPTQEEGKIYEVNPSLDVGGIENKRKASDPSACLNY